MDDAPVGSDRVAPSSRERARFCTCSSNERTKQRRNVQPELFALRASALKERLFAFIRPMQTSTHYNESHKMTQALAPRLNALDKLLQYSNISLYLCTLVGGFSFPPAGLPVCPPARSADTWTAGKSRRAHGPRAAGRRAN